MPASLAVVKIATSTAKTGADFRTDCAMRQEFAALPAREFRALGKDSAVSAACRLISWGHSGLASSTILPDATITAATGEKIGSWVHDAASIKYKKIGEIMSQSGEESASTLKSERKSGRAVFDDGRTVWEWQTATGVFERYVSEEQLARLEAAGLQLIDPSHQDTGKFIYGAEQARQARKQVFVARPAPIVRAMSVSALRQFLRRLVLST